MLKDIIFFFLWGYLIYLNIYRIVIIFENIKKDDIK